MFALEFPPISHLVEWPTFWIEDGPFAINKVVLGFFLAVAATMLLFGAVFVVKDFWWVEVWPLGITLIVTHLGLLFWETRYVSASLAFPGLKPSGKGA